MEEVILIGLIAISYALILFLIAAVFPSSWALWGYQHGPRLIIYAWSLFRVESGY